MLGVPRFVAFFRRPEGACRAPDGGSSFDQSRRTCAEESGRTAVEPILPDVAMAAHVPPDLRDPSLYLNRELSQLEFNARVLEQAKDPTTPLLERVRFLAICSTNLDEFF